jgi:hypothetical protein
MTPTQLMTRVRKCVAEAEATREACSAVLADPAASLEQKEKAREDRTAALHYFFGKMTYLASPEAEEINIGRGAR